MALSSKPVGQLGWDGLIPAYQIKFRCRSHSSVATLVVAYNQVLVLALAICHLQCAASDILHSFPIRSGIKLQHRLTYLLPSLSL